MVQRVIEAKVTVDGVVAGAISTGLMVLLGIEKGDLSEDAIYICKKIIGMRIFNDSLGHMNVAIPEVNGEILLISQFTLLAQTAKGNRPSFIKAARPEEAIPLYQFCIGEMEKLLGKPIATGIFGADMKVNLINDGPVTIFLDSNCKD